jgi:hypothetical protein
VRRPTARPEEKSVAHKTIDSAAASRRKARMPPSRVVRYSPMILAVASATNKIVAAQVRTVTQNNWRMANSCIRMSVV